MEGQISEWQTGDRCFGEGYERGSVGMKIKKRIKNSIILPMDMDYNTAITNTHSGNKLYKDVYVVCKDVMEKVLKVYMAGLVCVSEMV